MKCPFCNYSETKVLDSRPTEDNLSIRRRRECLRCQKRFTTYEKVEDIPVYVIKKDGSREPFNKRKILNGMLKSCEKRPIAISDLEKIVDDIEMQINNTMQQEVRSDYIGELVMQHLKKLDDVAYVRFASVYKQFKDINSFADELQKILEENKK
ncbi:MAG TPA: transcriptional regulator NrdR [Clostridiaceae bacterium]|jgi:transcriptional repressor NrdR|nr:transcriptional regulator NrdR [Clostridiaceae bacterium]HBF77628.1 transcriptional regulator NrdR [Clostridiaceae bacterium]HBG38734.1 transcriptional regulator NrdR [Clostridiaceae bacterium]HBN28481.1 transcriptional regulator NrdR [Clostridiaceae bacterium]HBX48380.1 transcriptional regulator NrdR [Clostridiaceae bacterium]